MRLFSPSFCLAHSFHYISRVKGMSSSGSDNPYLHLAIYSTDNTECRAAGNSPTAQGAFELLAAVTPDRQPRAAGSWVLCMDGWSRPGITAHTAPPFPVALLTPRTDHGTLMSAGQGVVWVYRGLGRCSVGVSWTGQVKCGCIVDWAGEVWVYRGLGRCSVGVSWTGQV
ncbi:hypothetical protein ACOMHN_039734 [Nucella lapillus]